MSKMFVDLLDEYGKVIGKKRVKLHGVTSVHHQVLAIVSDATGKVEAVDILNLKVQEELNGEHERMDATAISAPSNDGELGSSSSKNEGSSSAVRSKKSRSNRST